MIKPFWKVLLGDKVLANCKTKKAAFAYSHQWYLNNRDPITGRGYLPTVQRRST